MFNRQKQWVTSRTRGRWWITAVRWHQGISHFHVFHSKKRQRRVRLSSTLIVRSTVCQHRLDRRIEERKGLSRLFPLSVCLHSGLHSTSPPVFCCLLLCHILYNLPSKSSSISPQLSSAPSLFLATSGLYHGCCCSCFPSTSPAGSSSFPSPLCCPECGFLHVSPSGCLSSRTHQHPEPPPVSFSVISVKITLSLSCPLSSISLEELSVSVLSKRERQEVWFQKDKQCVLIHHAHCSDLAVKSLKGWKPPPKWVWKRFF